MRNENGITLATLVITIIVILIVSTSMIYSGVNTYKSMVKQNYLAEMQLIQAEVNKFVDSYQEKAENLGLDASNFKNIYVSIYENIDGFNKSDNATKKIYLEFHDFVNNYNSIEKNYGLDMEEINVEGELDATGSQMKLKSIPRLLSDKAGEHISKTGVGVSEVKDYLKDIWEEVLLTDGSEFLTILAGDNETQKLDKIVNNQGNYFYFSADMASQFFKMEISTDLAINFDERYVVSLSKFIEEEDDGGTVFEYHTEYFMIGGEKVIEYNPEFLHESKVSLDFSYNIEFEETNRRFKVTLTPSKDNTYGLKNLYYYSGYTDADQSITTGVTGNKYPEIGKNGLPVLVPKKSWNVIDGNTFYTAESGAFGIKIVDMQNNEAFRVIKVSYVNKPNVGGLIPILKEESYWRLVGENESWYNYANGQWANAMIDDVAKIVNGTTVSKLGSTFVWIPRFAYRIIYFKTENDKKDYLENNDLTKIAAYSNSSSDTDEIVRVNGNEYAYDTFLTDQVAKNYIVEVKFLMGTTNNDSTGTDVTTAYGGFFKVHPAFSKEGWGEEISGFWASKYNISESNGMLVSSPGAIKTENFINAFTDSYLMKYNFRENDNHFDLSTVDTHMMKNTEYGAIVLLTAALQGADLSIDNSNTKTDYGIYGLFDKNDTMVAGVSDKAYDSILDNVKNNLYKYTWYSECSVEDANNFAYMINNSKVRRYFDRYDSASGKPEEKVGDAIFEFAYKDSTTYSLQYSTLGSVVLDNTSDDRFYMIRGNDLSSGVYRFISVSYVTGNENMRDNSSTKCNWRVVLVNK